MSKFGKIFFGYQPTILIGAVLIAIPAGWITKVHMDWKSNKPDSKKRMLIAHGVFWSSMLLGFKALHAALFALPDRKVLSSPRNMGLLLQQLFNAKTRGPAAATLAVAVLGVGGFIGSMIGGFEGGMRLSKALVPKQPKPPQPIQLLPTPPHYFSPMLPNSSTPSLNLISHSPLTNPAILNPSNHPTSFPAPAINLLSTPFTPQLTPQQFRTPISPFTSVPNLSPIKPRLQTLPQTSYCASEINYPVWRN